jgi:hypothetical protein
MGKMHNEAFFFMPRLLLVSGAPFPLHCSPVGRFAGSPVGWQSWKS